MNSKHKYWAELDTNKESLAPIISYMNKETVTLLYSAHAPGHNNAVAFKEYLDRNTK